MPNTVDKAVEFIKPFLNGKLDLKSKTPLVVGIEGPQGSGKTTSATNIRNKIQLLYPECNIVQFSMDDFYVPYEKQLEINKVNSDNRLLQGRGLPGTHDITLLLEIFQILIENKEESFPVQIPVYDKSKHNGLGDRLDKSEWTIVGHKVDLIIFEGWFNGYMSISDGNSLSFKWKQINSKFPGKFEGISNKNVTDINTNLKQYEEVWNLFDLFVCIKTSDINNVYKWRLQQEHELIKIKGKGMSDAEVEKFVDRYMPIYYLYYDTLDITCEKIKSLVLEIDIERKLLHSNL